MPNHLKGKLSLSRRLYRTTRLVVDRNIRRVSLKLTGRQIVLGRFACLGRELLESANLYDSSINIQKGRVDYLMRCIGDPGVKARPWEVVKHLNGEDIFSLIHQEAEIESWRQERASLFFMDSYSELTDQIFRHRTGNWMFVSNYNDVIHDSDFERNFESLGLLDMSRLESCYTEYFDYIRASYPELPIVFVHFPIKLERRAKFRERYHAICDVIDRLRVRYEPFFSLTLDEADVFPVEAAGDDFPYHYGKKTYDKFAEKLRGTGIAAFNSQIMI
jgi:hypothetical protein